MSNVWRSILVFLLMVLIISAIGLIFYPGH